MEHSKYMEQLNLPLRERVDNWAENLIPEGAKELVFRREWKPVFKNEIQKLDELQRQEFCLRIAEDVQKYIKSEKTYPYIKKYMSKGWEWLKHPEWSPLDLYDIYQDEDDCDCGVYQLYMDGVDEKDEEYLLSFGLALHYFNYLLFYKQNDMGGEDMECFDMDSIYEVIGYYLQCEETEERRVFQLIQDCI